MRRTAARTRTGKRKDAPRSRGERRRRHAEGSDALVKAALETLAAQERLYHTILSNTPDLIYVFSLDHRYAYANDALLAIWGKTWDEAIGKNCLELGYPLWHADLHDREIEAVVATKRTVRGEVPFEGTNGRRIYDYIFVPVVDANGRVEAVAGTTRDVTDLRERASHLEAVVEARTSELKASIEELERFTYTVAHDLRAPLRSVHRFCELLLADAPPLPEETARTYLQKVAEGAKKMDRLIEDLLAYSRIGRSAVKRDPLDVGELLREAVASLSVQIQESGGAVTVAAEEACLALGDRLILTQVVVNLLTNALKFVPPGRKPRVEISAGKRDGLVRVSIQDNGLGIDPQYRDRVFHLFERLHGRERYPGTGIGLAIVSKAVDKLGGKVDFESEPGAGTRFWVDLPAA